MKKFLKYLGLFLLLCILTIGVLFLVYHESLPEGKTGYKAEELAKKMAKALNKNAYDNTEVFEWSFRNTHHYKWYKQEGRVEVDLAGDKVLLDLNDSSNSIADDPALISKALNNFNNDSFWLVAPYKIFDNGTERRLVSYQGKEALLVTYTSGGTTPGDSYLWILDENYLPIAYKMWTSIIPLGGVSATWSDLKMTQSGVQLPVSHTLSLFGLEISMGEVKAFNAKADALASKVLEAVNHEAYKKTRYLHWSFGGRRHYKWDKELHIVNVQWGDNKVILHPNKMEKSQAFVKETPVEDKKKLVKRAWDLFNNDSFWLVAPHKLFDDGTIRNIEMIDGKEALKVTYTTGGTTPGDSYIWLLDEHYKPMSYQMFVPSMKMTGTPATWEGWVTTESGTMLPTMHTFSSGGKLSMGEVKGFN